MTTLTHVDLRATCDGTNKCKARARASDPNDLAAVIFGGSKR